MDSIYFILLFSCWAMKGGQAGSLSLDDIEMDADQPPSQDHSALNMLEEQRQASVKMAMAGAMRRPDAPSRLTEVLPIVRIMSPEQRLALASLVMSQAMADPKDPLPAITTQPKNLTENLMLPISLDIATMFRGLGRPNSRSKQLLSMGGRRGIGSRWQSAGQPTRREVPSLPTGVKPESEKESGESSESACLAGVFCAESVNYPEKEIVSSLKGRGLGDTAALLQDSKTLPDGFAPPVAPMERKMSNERSSTERGSSVCASKVELARPKRARATSGLWKYIVNTGEYTQTLRLETCSKSGSKCFFLSEEVDSECVQVYNYHRLLTWDETTGLTMDIFKVPTCCSCRVRGYGGMPLPQSNAILPEESRPPIKVVRGVVRRRRPATVKHRGPPLPLDHEQTGDEDYPPYDNSLRRHTNESQGSRVGPNQRHPTLPAESVDQGPHMRPHKVNYSYHPILEFFRPARPPPARPDWTPLDS